MKKINFLILICSITALFACTNNDEQSISKEVVSLKFKKEFSTTNKNSDTLVSVDINVLSYAPLVIESNEVKHIQVKVDESSLKSDGLLLENDYAEIIDNTSNRLIETPGYIFNNRTQCFMYGTFITNTETGTWTFLFAVSSVQSQMNVCAPNGQMYAKKHK